METFLRAGLGNALLATVLALVAAGAGLVLRQRPAVRHGLWLLVLLKLVTPPLWVVPLAVPSPSLLGDQKSTSSGVERGGNTFLAEWDAARFSAVPDEVGSAIGSSPLSWLGAVEWARLAAAAWLIGSLLTLAVTGVRIRRWNRLLKLVEPASNEVQEEVERLAKQMGLARPPTSWWFPGPSAPMLWALGCQARLIVPRALWARLDQPQRVTLLVHELAHLRRKDHWVRVVELLATAFYWWLPLAWAARWALREAEEQCCDAWVVWTCPDALRAYAETLLDTVDFLSETGRAAPLAASGFGDAHHLKRRLTMIMQGKTPRGLGWTGLLAMLGLSTLLLPLSPTWAQKAEDEERGDAEVGREVEGKSDEAESSELDALKQKLAKEIHRLQSLEKRFHEKAKPPTRTIKPGEGPKLEHRDPIPKPVEPKKNAIIELRSSVLDKVRSLESHPEIFEAREIQLHFDEEHRGASTRDLARAKAEVERARAQLHRAESQLERLGQELKIKEAKSKALDRKSDGPPDEANEPTKESANLRRKMEQHQFDVIVRDKDHLKKLDEVKRDLIAKRLILHAPEKDQRIADLEKKLDELIHEVKSLKSKRDDSQK